MNKTVVRVVLTIIVLSIVIPLIAFIGGPGLSGLWR